MIRDKVSGPTCSNTTVIASTITNPIVTSLANLRIWIMWSKCPKICYLLETHFLHRRKDTRKTCSLEKLACTKQTIPMSTVNFVKKKKLTDQNKMQTPPQGKKYYFLAQNRDFSHEIPQKCSRLPPQLEKIWFFWRKIVIFHTKYPKNFRTSLHSAQFF